MWVIMCYFLCECRFSCGYLGIVLRVCVHVHTGGVVLQSCQSEQRGSRRGATGPGSQGERAR